MSLGNRLLNLRKSKGLSQEDVAEKLNVSRQTISKWETDQSTPDFDKILPLCKMYGISSDELLTGEAPKENGLKPSTEENVGHLKRRAQYIGMGILLYFVAVAWIMVTIPVFQFDPVLSTSGFILICGIATYLIIYANMVYGVRKKKEERERPQVVKIIESILSMITVCIYLFVSFTTGAWHITWLIWIVFAIVMEIVKLLFCLKGVNYEE